MGESGFNSTPKTKGVLLRAMKPRYFNADQEPQMDTKRVDEKAHMSDENRAKPSIGDTR